MLLAVLHSLELLLSELNFHFIARHFRIRNGGEKKKRKRKMKRRLVYSTREIYYRPFRGGTSRCREKFVLQKEEKKNKTPFSSVLVYALLAGGWKDLNRCGGKTETRKAGLVGQKIKLSLSPPLAGSPLSTFGRPSFASLAVGG